jgi:hypothetical protein
MELTTFKNNGYVRRVFSDGVYWTLDWVHGNDDIESWQYDVARYAFVPDYHIIRFEDFDSEDEDDGQETIISTHKTLAEALSILRVLLASGGLKYE